MSNRRHVNYGSSRVQTHTLVCEPVALAMEPPQTSRAQLYDLERRWSDWAIAVGPWKGNVAVGVLAQPLASHHNVRAKRHWGSSIKPSAAGDWETAFFVATQNAKDRADTAKVL